jgi:hypothetical protein
LLAAGTLDLMRKYENHGVPEIREEARGTIPRVAHFAEAEAGP